MKALLHSAALVVLVAGAPAAHAISDARISANGNEIYNNDAFPFVDELNRQISLDVGLLNREPVRLSFTLDAGDVGSTYLFDSVIDNLTGLGLENVYLRLDGGARFGSPGAVSLGFSDSASVHLNRALNQASIYFDHPQTYGFMIGNPSAIDPADDWSISFAGLSAGQTVELSIMTAVPEPESYALVLSGLAALAAAKRRRVGRRRVGR